MSAASCLLSEDELLCSICLEVLTDPVSTPCGHNFCKDCISENWRVSAPCRCPLCNEQFSTRPQLKTNVFISALVAQFRRSGDETEQCPRHHKPLELFCESDLSCVCVLCSLQHQNHVLLPLRDACEARQRELQENQAHAHSIILERTKISDIRQSLVLSQRAADEEIAEGVQLFYVLMELLHKGLDELLQEIEEKQNKAKTQAEALIQALEQEISELKQRSSEVEQLRRSTDHLHVLKTCSSLTAAPLRDCADVSFRRPSFLGSVQRAVLQIEKKLLTMDPKPLSESHLQELWRSAADVTLDPDSAHPELSLSVDLKQVTHTSTKRTLPDDPRRITGYEAVLGKQSVSSGRFYFEVQVSENTEWVLGMAKESINRKDPILATPANGFWTMWQYNGSYHTEPDVSLNVKSVLQRVGVFVDYEEDLVLFSDADTAALLHCFTNCSFSEKLYPYFYTVRAENNNSLTITPVRSRE